MFWVILIVLGLILFFVVSSLAKSKKIIVQALKDGNIIVFGHKGKGKDLMFQYMINLENRDYFSNMYFGGKYHELDMGKHLDLKITYENMIDNNYEIVEKYEELEGHNIYLSDAGIYFPAQYDSALHRRYKSLPLMFATQRHLYGKKSNFVCNTQALNRLWKALREQADSYIKCLGVVKILNVLVVKFRYYKEYESAERSLLPYKKRIIESKQDKANREQFENTYGEIKEGIILLSTKSIKYDTRAFHEKFFGKKFKG